MESERYLLLKSDTHSTLCSVCPFISLQELPVLAPSWGKKALVIPSSLMPCHVTDEFCSPVDSKKKAGTKEVVSVI